MAGIQPQYPSLADRLAGPERALWLAFVELKFQTNNFFAYYRAGRSGEPGEPWSLANAMRDPTAILCALEDPTNRPQKPTPWEGIYGLDPKARKRSPRPFMRPEPRGPGPSRLDLAGDESARNLQAEFKLKDTSIRVLRILGAGGNGIALLCDAESTTRGVRAKKFVLKTTMRGSSMRAEKAYMTVSTK